MKFLIYQSDLNKKYYFRFLNNDGRQLMRSEEYTTRDAAVTGIRNLKKLLEEAENPFNVSKTDRGNLNFTIKAKNNKVLATSVVFESQTALREARRYILANAPSATMEDQRPVV